MSELDMGQAGPHDASLHRATEDRRVQSTVEQQQHAKPGDQKHQFASDPFNVAGLHSRSLDNASGNGPLHFGVVIQSLGMVNWYRVQLDRGSTFIAACMGSESGFVPPGIVSTSPIPPRTEVVVFKPVGAPYGVILCALPYTVADGKMSIATILQQGGNTGIKRETAGKRPFQAFFRSGGVRDWSVHRPEDGTSMEWGKISATGIALLLDNFQAFLRVNELCGLFLNYFDSYTRLAGVNLDIQTSPWVLETREDEGELQHISENFVYPWEALGLYEPGEWTKEFEDKEIQYTKMKGKIDLPDGYEDAQAFSRYTEYGGYLGQGRLRLVAAPPTSTGNGKRLFGDTDSDIGLFMESIALDGSYLLQSAKQIALVKRVLIPVPKRLRLPEDQKTGDDARKDNYKFSGKFGNGAEHKVGDVEVGSASMSLVDAESEKSLLRAAGVLDLLSYASNWKAMHPFYYHKEDFAKGEAADTQPFETIQDTLNFEDLATQEFMAYPSATSVKVDHRYEDVDYFARESFIVHHEDGSISIGCGYGNQIRLGPNGISLETAGDIQLHAGRRILGMSNQTIIRTKGSIDLSSTEKDVRIKAKQNMQIVSTEGGLLLESRATGTSQQYQSKYGEDVRASGIVLLAKNSQIGLLGKDILLRTGGTKLGSGSITLDSDKGQQSVNLVGKRVNCFVTADLNVWVASTAAGDSVSMTKSHQFGKNRTKIDGVLSVEKSIYSGNNLLLKGGIQAQGSITTLGKVAQDGGGPAGDSSQVSDQVKLAVQLEEQNRTTHVGLGDTRWKSEVQDKWRITDMLGNDDLHDQMGFSFRDPISGSQYKTNDFKLLEPRWQQMVRLNMATGGEGWTEQAVSYQGRETYPFPGKDKLEGSTLLQYDKHTMFDEEKAIDKARGEVYETPKLGEFTPVKLDGNYKLIS